MPTNKACKNSSNKSTLYGEPEQADLFLVSHKIKLFECKSCYKFRAISVCQIFHYIFERESQLGFIETNIRFCFVRFDEIFYQYIEYVCLIFPSMIRIKWRTIQALTYYFTRCIPWKRSYIYLALVDEVTSKGQKLGFHLSQELIYF